MLFTRLIDALCDMGTRWAKKVFPTGLLDQSEAAVLYTRVAALLWQGGQVRTSINQSINQLHISSIVLVEDMREIIKLTG